MKFDSVARPISSAMLKKLEVWEEFPRNPHKPEQLNMVINMIVGFQDVYLGRVKA